MNCIVTRIAARIAAHLPASLLLCTALGALSPAQAGSTINKCIDGAGRVTLTDQACDANTVSSSVSVPGVGGEPRTGATQVSPVVAPVRWRPATEPATRAHAALSSDMATLKQARVQLLLKDAAPRTRLALLDR